MTIRAYNLRVTVRKGSFFGFFSLFLISSSLSAFRSYIFYFIEVVLEYEGIGEGSVGSNGRRDRISTGWSSIVSELMTPVEIGNHGLEELTVGPVMFQATSILLSLYFFQHRSPLAYSLCAPSPLLSIVTSFLTPVYVSCLAASSRFLFLFYSNSSSF
ncbi:hypothetical protein VTN00DRAFT_3937 [Thermoascus crustaceus]|uniref:uncharacterized protein n=1 Tax=Thermoascus crustaceus TaxID=5088 RepID=UPI003744224C